MNVQAFERCLPALQQIARFPNCNKAYVCRKRKVDLNEVESIIRDGLSTHGLRTWNDGALELVARDLSIKLPEYQPEPPSPVAEPEPPSAPAAAAVAPIARAEKAPTERGSTKEKGPKIGKREKAQQKYLKVCEELLRNPNGGDSAACRKVGIVQGSWKKKRFTWVPGEPIPAGQIKKVLKKLGGIEVGAESEDPDRRAAGQPSAPAKADTKSAPQPTTASSATGTISHEAHLELWEGSSDESNRRLAAAITMRVVGVARQAWAPDETIRLAFEIYDELQKHQDRHLKAKIREVA